MASLAATADVLQLLGEPTRVRLLALLQGQELTVADLTSITELAQSRVSTHLGRLREAGLLRDRRVGASTFYSLNDGAMPAEARKVWSLVARDLADDLLETDARRAKGIVAARERRAGWPDAVAGHMERYYSPGRTWEATLRGLIGLLHLGEVLDAGSGDGTIAELLAPRAKRITCLDTSEKLIEAARRRLRAWKHVRCEVGDLHALGFPDASFDQVLLFNVLTHLRAPAEGVAEAARVLRPGGDLVVITLKKHAHPQVTAAYHEVHPGFTPGAVRLFLSRAGLIVDSCDVTSREKRPPHFEVVTAFARKP